MMKSAFATGLSCCVLPKLSVLRIACLTLLISISSLSTVFAQGEICATAVAVTPGEYTSNGPATGNGASNECTFPISGTATHADWYSFTPVLSGTISVSACEGGADTRLSIHFGSCESLSCYTNNDDACSTTATSMTEFASELTDLLVIAGTTYYIEWDSRWNTLGFDWSLEFTPANDEPCDATPIACGESIAGTTAGASASGVDAICGTGVDNDVFFSLEATGGLEYTVNVNGANHDGILAAFTGDCNELTQIACADDNVFDGGIETVVFMVTESQTVTIQTYDWGGSSDFTIDVSCTAPANDLCTEATTLPLRAPGTCEGNEAIGTTEGAASDSLAGICESSSPDVFYRFFSGSFSTIIINRNSISATDLVINLLNDDCTANQLCGFGGGSSTLEVEPNTFYKIRVSTNISFGNVGTFAICVEGVYDCPTLDANFGDICNDGNPNTGTDVVGEDCICSGSAPPANDLCENAETLPVNLPGDCAGNEVTGTTIGALPDDFVISCDFSPNPGVFYTFNSGSYSSMIINYSYITASDLVITVKTGCAGDEIACSINSSSVEFSTIPNTDYIINVSSIIFSAQSQAGSFSICLEGIYDCSIFSGNIGDPCDDGNAGTSGDIIVEGCSCLGTPIPANDLCTNAQNLNVNLPGDCAGNETSGTTSGALVDIFSENCDGSNPGVFYAINSGSYPSININYSTTDPDVDLVVTVNTNCSGESENQVACDSNSDIETFEAEPNTEYIIHISSNTFFGSTGVFTICAEGIYDCTILEGNIGDACNDGNPDTNNDVILGDCSCVGVYDCPALSANIGDACDDGNADSDNDVITADCTCLGSITFDCPALSANIGDPCDDGNANTSGDIVLEGCTCEGIPIPANDLCTNAEVLGVNNPGDCASNETTGTTAGALPSPDLGTFACETFAPDVYYSFNSGDYDQLLVNLNTLDATDLVLSVYESCAADTESILDCNIDINQSESIATSTNTDYIIRVHSFDSVGAGSFQICIEGTYDCPALSANVGDACNDGDPATINDVVTAACACQGTASPPGTLTGTANWTSACGSRDMTVKLYTPGTSLLFQTYNTTITASGSFSVPGIPSGTYDIFVKIDGYLQKGFPSVSISTSGGSLAVGAIINGDINNSNGINISDLTSLSSSFGLVEGDSGYNPDADLNCSGGVNISDLTLLSSNFGLSGAVPPILFGPLD